MNINELLPGTELSVCTLIDNMPVTIKTKAISVLNGALVVGPLKYHGVPIPAATQATADAWLLRENRACSFNIESIIPYENWNDTFYLLKGTEAVGESENMRKAERYVVNILAKAVINHNHTASAIISDISIKGLSLLLGKGATADIGDVIRLTFKPAGYVRAFEINLTVMRHFKLGTYDAVGCKMRGIDSELMGYIMEIKRQKDDTKKQQSMSRVLINDEAADNIA